MTFFSVISKIKENKKKRLLVLPSMGTKSHHDRIPDREREKISFQ
ncbi:hypothetical protein BREVNS_0222 [Brevinematales bacterium NS]|nr:hypothetical protein BREVNS_0222 [Brevinematales bacterium NS]